MRTFRLGGIHPKENKLSAGQKIIPAPLPNLVTIPLAQSLGIPSSPLVAKGDDVKVGTLIARPGGFVSSGIHSPFSGKVIKVDDVYDLSGYRRPAIFIEVSGDEWEGSIDRSASLNREITHSSEDIIQKISEAGIVGLGGATFPTHIKMTPPPGVIVDTLIINGVECEPYLTADHRLMLEKPEEILVGTLLMMKATGVTKAFIAIENNKPDAIALLKSVVADYSGIEIVSLKVKYPQGSEKQLIEAITGKRVKSGALPVSVGVVVQNVATAFAVYEAVQKNKPLIERVVSVTGSVVDNPSNFLTRIGTPFGVLIKSAGGDLSKTGKIVSGGPMMGKAVVNAEVAVTKGCSGILVLSPDESKRNPVKNCIRCAKCVSVCPMGLEPYLLGSLGELQDWERAERESVMDCIECGSCSYTCPSSRPLVDFIRLGKNRVGAIIRNRKQDLNKI